MTPRLNVLAICVAALVLVGTTGAQAQSVDLGQYGWDRVQPAPSASRDDEKGAADFDYYALVLSWSPTHCAEPEGEDDTLQCNRRDGRRYGFVLHGLWPQHERGYPENCPVRGGRAFVPQGVIDDMLDIMPSRSLVIHEYRKHGTCSGMKAADYYSLARKLFSSIQIPRDYTNPMEHRMVAPSALVEDFLAANPDLDESMIAVSCRGSGNRLREVRLCFTPAGEPRACGDNESDSRMCRARSMFVPPVRSTVYDPDTAEARRKALDQSPLPGPRVIQSPR